LGVVLPDISSPDYIPTLITLCQEQQIEALLSFFDPDIDVLSRHLEKFRTIGVLPVVTSPETNNICGDKYRTYLFLREHDGFHAPKTFFEFVKAIGAVEAGTVAFPLIVKPRFGRASHDILKARNIKELDFFFHNTQDMLIQEMLTGKEYHLDICNDLHGQVLSVVPKRKVAMRAGETDQAETCDMPDLIDLGLRLGKELGSLGHVGPLDVDIFVQDDNLIILEINPRFGGGYPVAHLAGADFPRLILKMIRGETSEFEIGQFKPGVVMMKEYKIWGGESLHSICCNVINMRTPRNTEQPRGGMSRTSNDLL